MLLPAFFTSEPLSFIWPVELLVFWAIPRNGVTANDKATADIINDFTIFCFIFILSLCASQLNEVCALAHILV
jgi:hypothetical protein